MGDVAARGGGGCPGEGGDDRDEVVCEPEILVPTETSEHNVSHKKCFVVQTPHCCGGGLFMFGVFGIRIWG